MRRVDERIVLTMREASDLSEVLKLLAEMTDFDEFTGYDVYEERKKASRIYERLDDLLCNV